MEDLFIKYQNVSLELRLAGYAVVIFTPEELEGSNPCLVEDRLIEVGWDVIQTLK